MPKLKDTRLEEKEEVVIHGTILADEFRERATGKKIDPLGSKVTIDEIDSGNAPEDAVIMANGEGGASWVDLKHKDVHVQSINASQGAAITGPLAVTGNAAIGGDLAVNGGITGSSIIENMNGYSFEDTPATGYTVSNIYAGAVKNGNKLTLVLAFDAIKTAEATDNYPNVGAFTIPHEVMDKIYPSVISNVVDAKQIRLQTSATASVLSNSYVAKIGNKLHFVGHFGQAVVDTRYYFRYEVTFLLGENLASSGE